MGGQAIAIILSGSGSDGSRGVLEVARHGGFVISESPKTAKFDGIAKHTPDIALVDIGLPGIDGYEVARRTRANPDCQRTVLVALTGYGQQSDIDHAIKAGFDSHLVKPVDQDMLAAVIQSPNHRGDT